MFLWATASIAYWGLLGVASSIGLGFGAHTGALFLFPRIAQAAVAHREWSVARVVAEDAVAVLAWGVGTAVGELPPFLAARRYAARLPRAGWAGKAAAATRLVVQRGGALAVFLLGCWPNALFDLTGVAAGAGGMPLTTFLAATVAGKGFVKAPLQAAAVVERPRRPAGSTPKCRVSFRARPRAVAALR